MTTKTIKCNIRIERLQTPAHIDQTFFTNQTTQYDATKQK